jgi:hypothetical protein
MLPDTTGVLLSHFSIRRKIETDPKHRPRIVTVQRHRVQVHPRTLAGLTEGSHATECAFEDSKITHISIAVLVQIGDAWLPERFFKDQVVRQIDVAVAVEIRG